MADKLEGIQVHGERIAILQAKLRARDGRAEYKKNCEELRAEIKRLETIRVYDI